MSVGIKLNRRNESECEIVFENNYGVRNETKVHEVLKRRGDWHRQGIGCDYNKTKQSMLQHLTPTASILSWCTVYVCQ